MNINEQTCSKSIPWYVSTEENNYLRGGVNYDLLHLPRLKQQRALELTISLAFWKLALPFIKNSPAFMFNTSRMFPDSWKIARVTPIYKHKILLDDYKVRPELNKHKNI